MFPEDLTREVNERLQRHLENHVGRLFVTELGVERIKDTVKMVLQQLETEGKAPSDYFRSLAYVSADDVATVRSPDISSATLSRSGVSRDGMPLPKITSYPTAMRCNNSPG